MCPDRCFIDGTRPFRLAREDSRVYIEWCNEPGPAGTICRVRSRCQSQCVPGDALFAECDADAEAVCGGIVAPEAMRGC